VVGGRRSDTGRLGAFITQVKPGSVADTIGHLRKGDEVLEWNGRQLQNATFDQVYDAINSSRHDTQVELIVSRDEVLEWNGRQLQNATFDQVYDAINSSRHDTQVELIVSRSMR
ncbi:unnamed protein product, partial [Brugia pahangi]|uniref:PDZ domain-containing protein n=1 Tax=Brugia pahangi TaxID=6280 RepID=A0A0N4T820_BRUPA